MLTRDCWPCRVVSSTSIRNGNCVSLTMSTPYRAFIALPEFIERRSVQMNLISNVESQLRIDLCQYQLLKNGDSIWNFIPGRAWSAGRYTLVARGTLGEDAADGKVTNMRLLENRFYTNAN